MTDGGRTDGKWKIEQCSVRPETAKSANSKDESCLAIRVKSLDLRKVGQEEFDSCP